MTAEKDPLLNTMLNGRYHLQHPIGRGGFGQLYLATDKLKGRPCVVKRSLAKDAEAEKRFFREAVLLTQLEHPHLPQVHDFFQEHTHGNFLVMDYISGINLRKYVRANGTLTLEQLKPWVIDIIDALNYLHQHDPVIIHRDLKPDNIMLVSDSDALVVDFGLAKSIRAIPDENSLVISRGYSPPEQYETTKSTTQADQYALGAVIYFALTGKNPPDRSQKDVQIDKLSNLASVSQSVEQAVHKALAYKPRGRWKDLNRFYKALYGENLPVNDASVTYDPAYVGGYSADADTGTYTFDFTNSILDLKTDYAYETIYAQDANLAPVPTETYQTEAFTNTIWQEKEKEPAPIILTEDDLVNQKDKVALQPANPLQSNGILNGRYQVIETVHSNLLRVRDRLNSSLIKRVRSNNEYYLLQFAGDPEDTLNIAQRLMAIDHLILPKIHHYFYDDEMMYGYLVIEKLDKRIWHKLTVMKPDSARKEMCLAGLCSAIDALHQNGFSGLTVSDDTVLVHSNSAVFTAHSYVALIQLTETEEGNDDTKIEETLSALACHESFFDYKTFPISQDASASNLFRLAYDKSLPAVDTFDRPDETLLHLANWTALAPTINVLEYRKLLQINADKMQFDRAGLGCVGLVGFGLFMLSIAVFAETSNIWVSMSRLAFLWMPWGLWLANRWLAVPTFNKRTGLFHNGLRLIRLNKIYALQLLRNANQSTVTLNLVLENGKSVPIYKSGTRLVESQNDLHTLADFLDVPAWDATSLKPKPTQTETNMYSQSQQTNKAFVGCVFLLFPLILCLLSMIVQLFAG